MRMLKQRLVDCFKQNWHNKVWSSDRFCQYRSFKDYRQYESYLSVLQIKRSRDLIVRFRLGINELNNNKFRYSVNQQTRLCPLCGLAEEDETHFVFDCQAYVDIRNTFITDHLVPRRAGMGGLARLFDLSSIHNLVLYLTNCFKHRNEKLEAVHLLTDSAIGNC